MFFTDTKIEDNVYEKFARTVPVDARVKLLHLNNGVPDITFAEDYPNINQALSPNPETTRRNSVMDVQEYLLSWSDMNSYLKTGSINEDYIFRGLFVNNRDENSYKINKVDAVVYQIYDQYTEFCDSLALEGTLPAAVPVSKLKKVKNVFKVNDGIFEETGEIFLHLRSPYTISFIGIELGIVFQEHTHRCFFQQISDASGVGGFRGDGCLLPDKLHHYKAVEKPQAFQHFPQEGLKNQPQQFTTTPYNPA